MHRPLPICEEPGAEFAQWILAEVAQSAQLTPSQLLLKCRKDKYAHNRFLVFWLCRQLTNLTLGEIAQLTDKHHTTVLGGIQTLEKRMQTEPEARARAQEWLAYCRQHAPKVGTPRRGVLPEP